MREIGKELGKIYKRAGYKLMLESTVEEGGEEKQERCCEVKTPKGNETLETDVVLSAVGVVGNIENLGLEKNWR